MQSHSDSAIRNLEPTNSKDTSWGEDQAMRKERAVSEARTSTPPMAVKRVEAYSMKTTALCGTHPEPVCNSACMVWEPQHHGLAPIMRIRCTG